MVAPATKAKWGNTMLDLYALLYKDRYGHSPMINRYREKWNMGDVCESVGLDKTKELLQFYFKTGKDGHPLDFFMYNFDKLELNMKEAARDKSEKAELRRLTEERVMAYREQRRGKGPNSSLSE